MLALFSHMALLITFFTRLPVPDVLFKDDVSLDQVIWGVPLVGALIGGIVCGVMSLLVALGVPFALVVLVGFGLGFVISGALHEDGLADFLDGLGVRGRNRALQVMHDSRIGSFGALGLIFSFVWRGAAVFELMVYGVGPLAVLLMHVGGRGMMVPLMLLPTARSSGLAAQVRERKDDGPWYFATGFGVLVALVLTSGIFLMVLPWLQSLIVLGGAGLVVFLVGLIAMRRLGGVTGDVYGAAEQGAEMAIVGLILLFFVA